MRKPLSLSRVVRRPEMGILEPGNVPGRAGTRLGLSLAVGIFLGLGCIFLSACSSPFGGSGIGARSTSTSTQTLSKIAWCEKPLMIFRDEGATATATTGATATSTSTASTPAAGAGATTTATSTSTVSTPAAGTGATATATSISTASTPAAGAGTPQTVTDWSLVKANLGFTVYLPTTLPSGSCLVSAQATIHDPIFGGSFTIGYLLPDHTSLSFSEAPLKSQNLTFQCNSTTGATTPTSGKTSTKATPTPTPNTGQLCSGAKTTTNIVLSGPGTANHLQQIFNTLQPDVNWIPAS